MLNNALLKKVVGAKLYKQAFKIEDKPSSLPGQIGHALANSVGHLTSFPANVLVGQEKALDLHKDFNKKELLKEIGHLKKDPRLKDVLVRVGHSDIGSDFKRLFASDQFGPIGKLLVSPSLLVGTTAANRMNHYNPLTNTVELYGKIPEIAHHELGHARDFNQSDLHRSGYMLGSILEGKYSPVAGGPLTQYLESNANTEAEKGYRGDMREFRRRLWPARGTYWGSLLGGLALLHPSVREAAGDFMSGADSPNEEKLRGVLLGLGVAGTGALGGRLFAEARNLFDDGKKKNKASS